MTDSNFCTAHMLLLYMPVCLVFLLCSFALVDDVKAEQTGDGQKTLYELDFTTARKDARAWLLENGFDLAKDMKNQKRIAVKGGGKSGGITLKAPKAAFGFAVKSDLNIEDVEFAEVEWGVHQYPGEGLWRVEKNREALMVQLFFGEKVKADKFYLPDSPHLIGMSLCKGDPLNTPFVARSYTDTARYVCLDEPPEGTTITSRFNVKRNYKEWFATTVVPPVTGIGVELDTSDLETGTASAFIKRITLFGKTTKR